MFSSCKFPIITSTTQQRRKFAGTRTLGASLRVVESNLEHHQIGWTHYTTTAAKDLDGSRRGIAPLLLELPLAEEKNRRYLVSHLRALALLLRCYYWLLHACMEGGVCVFYFIVVYENHFPKVSSSLT